MPWTVAESDQRSSAPTPSARRGSSGSSTLTPASEASGGPHEHRLRGLLARVLGAGPDGVLAGDADLQGLGPDPERRVGGVVVVDQELLDLAAAQGVHDGAAAVHALLPLGERRGEPLEQPLALLPHVQHHRRRDRLLLRLRRRALGATAGAQPHEPAGELGPGLLLQRRHRLLVTLQQHQLGPVPPDEALQLVRHRRRVALPGVLDPGPVAVLRPAAAGHLVQHVVAALDGLLRRRLAEQPHHLQVGTGRGRPARRRTGSCWTGSGTPAAGRAAGPSGPRRAPARCGSTRSSTHPVEGGDDEPADAPGPAGRGQGQLAHGRHDRRRRPWAARDLAAASHLTSTSRRSVEIHPAGVVGRT